MDSTMTWNLRTVKNVVCNAKRAFSNLFAMSVAAIELLHPYAYVPLGILTSGKLNA